VCACRVAGTGVEGGERGEGGEQVQHGIEKILAPARTC
jgi:hypothetical protein